MGPFSSSKDRPPPKKDLPKWIKATAKNDNDYGRDNPKNPGNKPNGKW